MLNVVWLCMVVIAIMVGIINGKTAEVVTAVTDNAKLAFEIALGLTGVMTFWLGLMKMAEKAGLIHALGHLLRPLMQRLFPEVPADHPAMGSMLLNIAANMLGLVHAATPFGLKAMEDLETLNKRPGTATHAMCMFLAINTSSVQLIPMTAIAYLAAAGATRPTQVVVTSLIATTCSTLAAIIAVKCLQRTKL